MTCAEEGVGAIKGPVIHVRQLCLNKDFCMIHL